MGMDDVLVSSPAVDVMVVVVVVENVGYPSQYLMIPHT